jgi:hypothetical protein
MYLPLYLNAPALVGGILVHFLDRRALRIGGDRGRTVRERGIVIASGLMAGGALGGVIGAAMRLVPGYREDWIPNSLYSHDAAAQIVSITGFTLFVVYTWWAAQRVPKN